MTLYDVAGITLVTWPYEKAGAAAHHLPRLVTEGAKLKVGCSLGCRFGIRTDSVEGRIRADSGGFRAVPEGISLGY
jgi:hypothetical protein